MAAVVTATAARLIRVDREAAGHRQAATGPQGARERPVAEIDDAAPQLPHRPAVEPALAEREPDSDAEIVEEPRHILAGNGVGTNPLNVLEQGEGLLDLGLHVELLRPHGQAGRGVFTITVTNVNEAPAALALSATTVLENQPASTVVGTLSTVDPDVGNTVRYLLVPDATLDGTGLFEVVGNQVRTKAVFNTAIKSTYSIRVRSTDQGGLFFARVFTITVGRAT